MVWVVMLMLFFSCASLQKKGQENQGVVSCKPTLDPKALRPAVCGKCEIKVERGKLVVREAKGCPPYEVYQCSKKDGSSFFINNFACTPDRP